MELKRKVFVGLIVLLFSVSSVTAGLEETVLEKVRDATVMVFVHRQRDGKKTVSSGSGFFVSKEGYVVTCQHVIAEKLTYTNWRGDQVKRDYNVKRIQVVVNAGTQRVAGARARVIREYPERDLAILKVDDLPVNQHLDFAKNKNLQETQDVWCFGYPLGDALAEGDNGPNVTITEGQITSLRRKEDKLRRIQTDVSVTQGNSGGPVVNGKGQVIGIIYLKVGRDSGINMAIPGDEACMIVTVLKIRSGLIKR